MHATYSFHFLETVSEQLIATLDSLSITPLNEAALKSLQEFQKAESAHQGVYLLYYANDPVYLGKANNIRSRLAKHLKKLTGRRNIDLLGIGYKALLLDRSMGTAANESLLISLFKRSHTGMWNGEGFGPNDPGKNRDKTRPGAFDRDYPIRSDWPIDYPEDHATLGAVLAEMKLQLPYVLRYELGKREGEHIDLSGVPRNAQNMLEAIVRALGAGWKGVILSYGMIVYQTRDRFPFGKEILP